MYVIINQFYRHGFVHFFFILSRQDADINTIPSTLYLHIHAHILYIKSLLQKNALPDSYKAVQ